MSKEAARSGLLVWMDLEMTGLEPDTDEILEIAVVITDQNLNIVAQGPDLILRQPPERFARMDQWNRDQHTKTGLWASVLASSIDVKEAEEQVLSFIKQHVEERKSPLCGNSVWQDRRFLYKHMPRLESYLHYRIVDVSTVKELAVRWYPEEAKRFTKSSSHRALDDVIESIDELKFYRSTVFLKPEAP